MNNLKENLDRKMKLPLGKVENHILREIVFTNSGYVHPRVVDRPKVGDDCGSIKVEEGLCVVSTDPITAAAEKVGSLSIDISCNDIATRGVRPIGITLAIMLPYGTTLGQLENIMKDAGEAALRNKIEIIGGHTEVTQAVNTPVIVSTAFGYEKFREKNVAAVGDLIIMTKHAGIEGSGIISWDKAEAKNILTEDELNEARKFLSFTSVIDEGEIAGNLGFVKMHDVTEGGVLGGIWELCQSLDLGCLISKEAIRVSPITKKLCDYFNMDYLKLISSGSMLIIIKEDLKNDFEREFKSRNLEYSIIGSLKSKDFGRKIQWDEKTVKDIYPPEKDHLYIALE